MKKDLYKIIKEHSEEICINYYDKNHDCYDFKKKKAIGKFKDELSGILLPEYCGLREKMYSYSFETQDKIKNHVRCKGIKMSVVSKSITMGNFKRCLFKDGDTELYREMICIGSYKHDLYSIKTNKLPLSPKDEKRFLKYKREILPWGIWI